MEIAFSVTTKYGNYNDTLFFPDDEVPSDDEIKKLKNERIRRWAALFSTKNPVDQEEAPEMAAIRLEREKRILKGNMTSPLE